MSELTQTQKASFAYLIRTRDCELRDEIRAALLQSGDERFIEIAGAVHDLADDSVADALRELESALVERHLQALREIGGAYRRLADGSINRCVDCGGDVGFERLMANPVAVRCVACQNQKERTYAHELTPRL